MATLHAEADAVAYRTSPRARQVIDDRLAKNPENINASGHGWDVGRMDIYHEDRWQPIFAEMRKVAPVNKVTGTIHGDYWNVCTLKAIQHVEALPELFSSSYTHGGVSIIEPPKKSAIARTRCSTHCLSANGSTGRRAAPFSTASTRWKSKPSVTDGDAGPQQREEAA